MLVDEVIGARVGSQIAGRWTLDRVLGIGGMAAVYAAHDAEGHEVAIKLLHPEISSKPGVRERFLREGTVANRIAHPGAVRVLEHGSDAGGEAFLVMELLRGEPLNERVKRAGKLPVGEVLRHLDQVLDVLAAAHDAGIVHRDLKPDNLFLTESGQVKVLDFGVARLLDALPGDYQTKTGIALGTLPYMAPEQALGRRAEIDGRVDLFALGASAFRMLTGRRIHEGDSEAELLLAMASKPAPPLAALAPDVSPGACAVIDLALAFSRDARYPDARAMQSDVRAVLAGQPPLLAMRRAAEREQATAVNLPAIPFSPVSARDASVSAHALPDPRTAFTTPDAGPPASGGRTTEPGPPSSQLTSMTLDLGPPSAPASAPIVPQAVTPQASAPSATPRRGRRALWISGAAAAVAAVGIAAGYTLIHRDSDPPLPPPITDDSAHTPSPSATARSSPTPETPPDAPRPPATATRLPAPAPPRVETSLQRSEPEVRRSTSPVTPPVAPPPKAPAPVAAPTTTAAMGAPTARAPAPSPPPPPAAPPTTPAPDRTKPGKAHKHR